METDFDYLRCPMCGGELIYSEGTHDLCCRRNSPEAGEAAAGAEEQEQAYAAPGDHDAPTLCEEREAYGASPGSGGSGGSMHQGFHAGAPAHGGRTGLGGARLRKARQSVPADRPHVSRKGFRRSAGLVAREGGAPSGDGCLFALSFTGSGGHGTLWSVRTDHHNTNYFALMRLFQRIEKRVENGEQLAPNIPNTARKVERSPVLKLAFKYGLEEEDIYSIRHSTESVERLAHFYNLTEGEIRVIKRAKLEE
ncbi:MAG TPA: hypothetical protein PKC29_13885 [Thermodesulfobacteriota bacterium]|nr:hypothetical protein [Thermodesulfobacteriota bacterium]